MLRSLVLVAGVLCLAGGLVALRQGVYSAGVSALVFGGLVVVGVLYEQFRYKPLERTPLGGDWVATEERFIDGETGRLVTVYVDRRTGERKYVDG